MGINAPGMEANGVKLEYPWLMKIGALVGTGWIRWWMGSLEFKAWFADPEVDPAFSPLPRRIYLFWHEYLLFPFYLRGHCDVAILLSRHRDAEILAESARLMGFAPIRGSTRRGGTEALCRLLRQGQAKHIGITPDGPRGPRRHLAPGAVYLASRLEMPVVLIGIGYDRPWRIRGAWDQFALPRPFSRARAILSQPISVPAQADRATLEEYRSLLQTRLNELTLQAERWAASGARWTGEQIVHRQPCRNRPFRSPPSPLSPEPGAGAECPAPLAKVA